MKYVLNFDMNKIKELNQHGMRKFNAKVEDRKLRAEKETNLEARKKIKAEKIEKLVLDTDDLLILRFLYTMGNEPKTVRLEKDSSFFWVKYDSLLNEYEGLLFLTKTALNNRLNKYADMQLIERKCVRNEDGTFSFFKLTGINDLIHIPPVEPKEVVKAKEPKKEAKAENKKPVDSNGNTPIDGQVHISEVEEIVKATGVSVEEAQEELTITKSKENIVNDVNYTIGTINNKKKNEQYLNSKLSEINPMKFNNFEAREYDYDALENSLLGWDKSEEATEVAEVIEEDTEPKVFNKNGIEIGSNVI